MNVTNVTQTQLAAAIDRYKTEIIDFMVVNPEVSQKQGSIDTVDITNMGRLLYDLSRSGNEDFRQILGSVMEDRPDTRFDTFMQAYCAIYGVDYVGQMIRYDRYGRGRYSEYYAALKKYFATFGDYMLDDSDEEEDVPRNFKNGLLKAFKKLVGFFKS